MKNNIWPAHSTRVQSWVFWVLSFILLLPIFVLPPSFNPSNWSRVMLFKIALGGLLLWLCYQFFTKKDLSFIVPTRQNPAFLPLTLLAGFFAVMVISTAFSADIWFSFFGGPGRAGGLLNLLFYFFFALLITSFVKEDTRRKLLHINLAVGIITSFLAVVQYFGIFNKILISFTAGGAGVPSFIGNSTLLAIYMVFLVFSAFTFFITEENRQKKYGYAALCLLFLITIVITGSRAAYLAMMIAGLFYLLWYPQKLKTAKMIAIGIIIAGIAIVALLNIFPQIGNSISILQTVTTRVSITNIANDLAGSRLPAWNMTWQAIKERPLLGWGPENFYVGFEKYYAPDSSGIQKEWWDRPHNILLDIAIHYGIPALLIYLAFWAMLFFRLQQFKQKESSPERTFLAHSIQAMFIGYAVILFFNFDEFPTYLMAFFFIGLALALISSQGSTKEILPPARNHILGNKPIASVAALGFLAFVWFWNIMPIYIGEALTYNSLLVGQHECQTALPNTSALVPKAGIMQAYTARTLTDYVKSCAFVFPEKESEYAQISVAALKKATTLQPLYSRGWIALGGFTNILAAREPDTAKRQELLAEAREALFTAQTLSPKRIETLTELQTNYLLQTDYAAMKATAKQCLDINPSQGVCYWFMGIAEIFTGNIAAGEKQIELSKEQGYTNPNLLQLAIAYLSQEEYKKALETYDRLILQNGQVAAWHAQAALLAKELGDYQKAAKEALEVFRIQPQNPESLQFLQLLFQEKSSDPVIRAALGQAYGTLGATQGDKTMLSEAVRIYEQLIKEYPQNADYHLKLAYYYNETNQHLKARDQLIIAVKLQPSLRKEAEQLLDRMFDHDILEKLP